MPIQGEIVKKVTKSSKKNPRLAWSRKIRSQRPFACQYREDGVGVKQEVTGSIDCDVAEHGCVHWGFKAETKKE
jgi:hypothetical protein